MLIVGTERLRDVRLDGLAELRMMLEKFGIADLPRHPLLIRWLLPEERLNPGDEKEFEIVDGNNRLVLFLEMGHSVYNNYEVILNETKEQESKSDDKEPKMIKLTWEV